MVASELTELSRKLSEHLRRGLLCFTIATLNFGEIEILTWVVRCGSCGGYGGAANASVAVRQSVT